MIELKRPSQKIDDDVANQIRKYAFAVALDERFLDTKTRWTFLAVSNEVNESVRRQTNQRDKPRGLLHDDAEANISIWIKTWAQIIRENQARLQFYQERLDYSADNSGALEYLKQTHSRYLPNSIKDTIPTPIRFSRAFVSPLEDEMDESDPFADP